MQAYSNPARETDPHALPDLEIFHLTAKDAAEMDFEEGGWFYWYCFPGCIPDSEPIGPFTTSAEALDNARQYAED